MSPLPGVRNLQVESIYEYGSRVGFWRLLRLFAERDIKISVFAVAMALERHPEAARAIVEAGHEVVSHGWRWIDYQFVDEAVEREHMRLAVETLDARDGEPAPRLVHGPPQSQYAAPRRGARRVPLRRRRLQRRPAVLGPGRRQAAPRGPVHARQQRHEVRHAAGLQHGRRLLHVPPGCVRHALRGRGRGAEDDVGGPARAARRAAGPAGRARALPRPRRQARPRLDLPPPRHRQALGGHAPVPPPDAREVEDSRPGGCRRPPRGPWSRTRGERSIPRRSERAVRLERAGPGASCADGPYRPGRSQRRNWPWPGWARSLPSSTTISPRESTTAGQPRTLRPSYGV